MYLNNRRVASSTNTSGLGTRTTDHFGIGTYDVVDYGQAFNGYISDFKLYHSANTFGIFTEIPQITSTALSPLAVTCNSSGDVVTVSAGSEGVYRSTDGGATWSLKDVLTAPTTDASVLMPITAIQAGLNGYHWSTNNIGWEVSASTYQNGQFPYIAFR